MPIEIMTILVRSSQQSEERKAEATLEGDRRRAA
jgi:hypothetical protein